MTGDSSNAIMQQLHNQSQIMRSKNSRNLDIARKLSFAKMPSTQRLLEHTDSINSLERIHYSQLHVGTNRNLLHAMTG